ncbi:hypothetical protein [Segatella sp.]|uniref:hypothetical protein n=1 Tax=Segatella sp. TaxID=2974253 RepID=UPI003AB0D937
MATEAKNTNYWISSTALYIQLNSMGEPDYIQCSVVSGASVLCYMSDVPGLGYDAGHNYQRWTLAAYPSIFPDSKRKYVYIAIPRQSTTDNNQATVVFPGQKIDIYGKTIPSSGTEGVQIGNEAYYYIFTGGIISAVKTDADNTRKREWEQHFDCGKLATDEAIASGGEGAWWRYNSVSDTITFLKEILKANFNELSAKVARVTRLFLGGHELKGVADSNGTLETSNDTVVTPQYLGQFGVKHFLAKDKDDTVHGTITFEKVQKFVQGLTAEYLSQFKKGATFGEFIQGMLFGTGGRIDELGNAEFESITSRSSIIAKELIVNRQTAMESNFVFTESGMVESVTEIPAATEGGNVTYDLKLQKRWGNDFTAFKENDVVLASINTLAENGKYYDMWLRVLSVNTVTNTITVVCYPDDECPSKKNYPPCELARLIRWGNAVDEDRQSCWYISSSEGLLVWLDHVTKPIIDKTNYSLAMGKLPDALSFLFQDFPTANKRDGAFYAKWMMAASFQQIDYQGNPIYTTRDRGVWSLSVAQGDNPYRNGDRTIDTVYYLGCKWQCLEDKTTKPPIYSSTAWAFVEGNPYFTLEMQSSKLWNFRLNDLMATNADGSWKVFTTLSVVGRLYNQDVTDSMVNVVWTRDSGNPTADNKWALSHANCGLSVDLTYEDLGGAAFKIGSVTFRCDAEIKDGETMYSEDVSVSF